MFKICLKSKISSRDCLVYRNLLISCFKILVKIDYLRGVLNWYLDSIKQNNQKQLMKVD